MDARRCSSTAELVRTKLARYGYTQMYTDINCNIYKYSTGVYVCSRTSFFGGGPLCSRPSVTHWLDSYQPPKTIARPAVTARVRKSIVPKSYPNDRGSRGPSSTGVVVPVQSTTTTTQDKGAGGSKVAGRRVGNLSASAAVHRNTVFPSSETGKEEKTSRKRSSPIRPRMKGTFYGEDQPPAALQPIPVMPSYSDQSDCDSLIDDADADVEDVAWVGELMNTLGDYATRDFSHIDSQRDRRMQTSFDQIMREEESTLNIAIKTDKREARKLALASKKMKKKKKKKKKGVSNLVYG